MTSCDCCIQLDTPQSIHDEGNEHYPAGTDIFEVILDEVSWEQTAGFYYAFWAAFRYRIIANCNTEEWVQVMKDRLMLVGDKWDAVFSKYLDENVDLSDLSADSYERIIQRTAMAGTEGDVRTHKYEHERLPETAAGTTKYLDSRDESTDKYAPNTQDKETYKEDVDLNAKTFNEMMRAYPDILIEFAKDFEQYFLVML